MFKLHLLISVGEMEVRLSGLVAGTLASGSKFKFKSPLFPFLVSGTDITQIQMFPDLSSLSDRTLNT